VSRLNFIMFFGDLVFCYPIVSSRSTDLQFAGRKTHSSGNNGWV
jgi:hypothetical protein